MNQSARSLSLCLVGISLFTTSGQSQEVLDRRGRGTGFVESLILEERPNRLFRFNEVEGGVGPIGLNNGMIFAERASGHIQAIESEGKKVLWMKELAAGRITGITHAQAVDGMVATSYDGATLFGGEKGNAIWTTHIEHGLAEGEIVEDHLYAASYDGQAYCIRLTDGEVVWRHDYLSDAPEDPPGFRGDHARFGKKPARPRATSSDGSMVVFSVFDQCRIVALDCKTGERRWDFQTQGWIYGCPTIGDEYVFIGSQDKKLYCIDKTDGSEVWSFATGSRIEATPSVAGSQVFVGSCDANLYCIDRRSGELNWSFATKKRKKNGGPIYEQPIVGPNTVYLPTMEGTVYALDRQTGYEQWSLRPSRHSEIDGSLTDGTRIYVTTRLNSDDKGEKTIYAIGE